MDIVVVFNKLIYLCEIVKFNFNYVNFFVGDKLW